MGLEEAVKIWPSPTVADAEGGRTSKGAARPDECGLAKAARLFPTPKAQPSGPDFARASREGSGGDDLATAVARATSTRLLNEVAVTRETFPSPCVGGDGETTHNQVSGQFRRQMAKAGVIGSLEPEFVTWLMGWPRGWTGLDLLSLTPWSPEVGPWVDGEWPDVPRVSVGVKNRKPRLMMLGNGWVPQTAAIVGRAILRAFAAPRRAR
jgi:DNA (cytosine-5)-methyltransferase 1